MKDTEKLIQEIFDSSSNIILDSKNLSNEIEKSVIMITKSIKNGNKLVIFGNGGSAADAQHMAAEFVGRFMKERKSFPAIALSTDSSIITAIGNDYGFEKIFSRQIESLVKKGDVVIAISTSGKSENVINAIKQAKFKNLKTIFLNGEKENLNNIADLIINVQSSYSMTLSS